MLDPAATGTFEIRPPVELLAHAPQGASGQQGREMHVEGWKGSWLSRLFEKLIGED